jgi:excisionase family DNA binding protein
MATDLIDVAGIAELLGASRRTVFRYVAHEKFPAPAVELSRKRLWRRAAVKRWADKTLPLPKDPRQRAPKT